MMAVQQNDATAASPDDRLALATQGLETTTAVALRAAFAPYAATVAKGRDAVARVAKMVAWGQERGTKL